MNQQTISQKYWHKLWEIRRVAKEIRERKAALKREKILMNTNTKEPSEERSTEESVKAVCHTCYGAGGSLYGGPCKECGQPPTAQPTTKPDNAPAGEVDLEMLRELYQLEPLVHETFNSPLGDTGDFEGHSVIRTDNGGVWYADSINPDDEHEAAHSEIVRRVNAFPALLASLSSAKARIGELEEGLARESHDAEQLYKECVRVRDLVTQTANQAEQYRLETHRWAEVAKRDAAERDGLWKRIREIEREVIEMEASLASRDAEIERLRGALIQMPCKECCGVKQVRIDGFKLGPCRFCSARDAALQTTNPQADEVEGGKADELRLSWLLALIRHHGTDGASNIPWTVLEEDGEDSNVTLDREAIDKAMVLYPDPEKAELPDTEGEPTI